MPEIRWMLDDHGFYATLQFRYPDKAVEWHDLFTVTTWEGICAGH